MATTLATYKGVERRNYCTFPSIDVEILPATRHCLCGAEVVFDQAARWFVHTDGGVADHRVDARLQCSYCHAEEGVVYCQHAWFDAVECSRCGGVTGFAVGD